MRTLTNMFDGVFTTPTAGNVMDMGSESSLAVHIVVSAISGAGASATFVLEDSADGATWANVATSGAVTTTGTIALRSTTPAPIGQLARVRLSALAGTSPSITTTTKGRATA